MIIGENISLINGRIKVWMTVSNNATTVNDMPPGVIKKFGTKREVIQSAIRLARKVTVNLPKNFIDVVVLSQEFQKTLSSHTFRLRDVHEFQNSWGDV